MGVSLQNKYRCFVSFWLVLSLSYAIISEEYEYCELIKSLAFSRVPAVDFCVGKISVFNW